MTMTPTSNVSGMSVSSFAVDSVLKTVKPFVCLIDCRLKEYEPLACVGCVLDLADYDGLRLIQSMNRLDTFRN